jgi:hypothetical protein
VCVPRLDYNFLEETLFFIQRYVSSFSVPVLELHVFGRAGAGALAPAIMFMTQEIKNNNVYEIVLKLFWQSDTSMVK